MSKDIWEEMAYVVLCRGRGPHGITGNMPYFSVSKIKRMACALEAQDLEGIKRAFNYDVHSMGGFVD